MNPFPRRWYHHCLLVAICYVVPTSLIQAEDWPRFRGPNANGVSSDTKIPTEWSDAKNLKWKLELPGAGFSSPIVVGDFAFVTCYSDAKTDIAKLKRHLVCVNRRTGSVAWTKTVPSAVRERRPPRFGGSHGFASHTPVSDGKHVFVMFGNTGVLAFDLKGKELWRKSVGSDNAAMFGSGASPILYKDKLIVTAASESQTIRAFDKTSGKELWKAEGSLSRSYSTPVVGKNAKGDDELLVAIEYEVWGMNPATGKLKWYAQTRVDTNSCPSVLVDVIGERTGGRTAVRLGGKGDVSNKNQLWSTGGGSYVPSPVLHKGHLYWINDNGIAYCVDVKTGKEVGRKRIGGKFYGSVVLIGNKLYAVSRFGGTYVFEATPKLTQIARNRLSDTSDFSGSPAVSDGQFIFRSDKFLYCVEAE